MGLLIDLKEIFFTEKCKLRKRMTFSIILSLIGFGIIVWFLFRILKSDGHYDPNHKINLPNAGLVGDFIGGLTGTLFSIVGVILLFETLNLQRKEFEETRKVLKQEQFENTFFALIGLYKDSLKKITEWKTGKDGDIFMIEGLEYFEYKRIELYKEFNASPALVKSTKAVRNSYTIFYLRNKTSLSIYFRTLYRIYNFIDESSFDSITKMKYAKIFRAQLNEDELFFIYYNAFSIAGSKSRELINTFNFTKHLSIFSKLEYKEFASKLDSVELSSVESIFDALKSKIKEVIHNKNYHFQLFGYLENKYQFKILNKKTELEIEISIDRNKIATAYNLTDGYGIQKFSEEELENLVKTFLLDTFEYSNFQLINKGLETATLYRNVDNQYKIIITIKNTNGVDLKLPTFPKKQVI